MKYPVSAILSSAYPNGHDVKVNNIPLNIHSPTLIYSDAEMASLKVLEKYIIFDFNPVLADEVPEANLDTTNDATNSSAVTVETSAVVDSSVVSESSNTSTKKSKVIVSDPVIPKVDVLVAETPPTA
jgi:hypothetical protein